MVGQLIGHALTRAELVPKGGGWLRYMPHPATCRAITRRGRGRGTPRPQTTFDGMETETR